MKVFQAVHSDKAGDSNCDADELVMPSSNADFMVGFNSRLATTLFTVVEVEHDADWLEAQADESMKVVFGSLMGNHKRAYYAHKAALQIVEYANFFETGTVLSLVGDKIVAVK